MRITVRLSTDILKLLNNLKGKTISDKLRNAIKLANLYQEKEEL